MASSMDPSNRVRRLKELGTLIGLLNLIWIIPRFEIDWMLIFDYF